MSEETWDKEDHLGGAGGHNEPSGGQISYSASHTWRRCNSAAKCYTVSHSRSIQTPNQLRWNRCPECGQGAQICPGDIDCGPAYFD
jgi:flavoprotein